jgi:CheY-like chemotaxis protein
MIDRVQLGAGKHSVLLVDDDHFIREIGCLAVRQIGVEAFEASSLTEAVNVLTSHGRISLVISDVQMPGGSGVELLNRMKQDETWSSIPFALMTGGPLSDLPVGVLVLRKPFVTLQVQCVVVANLGGMCPKADRGSGINKLGPCDPERCDIYVNEWSPMAQLRGSQAC